MSTYRLSDKAADDLQEIKDYLVPRSRPFARRLLSDIEQRCRVLARLPQIGRPRDDLAPGLRSVPVKDYLIFFRPAADGSGIEIARVLHGSRNITPDLFFP